MVIVSVIAVAGVIVVGPAAELDVPHDGVLGAAGAVISDPFALDQSAGDGIRTTAPRWWGPSRGTLALCHERVSGWSPDADGFAAQ